MSTWHRVLALALAVPASLALAACAGEAEADGRDDAGGPAALAEIATWAAPVGIAPELVYVTDIDGFELETQTVGVMGDDGFSAGYSDDDAEVFATVLLTTSRDAEPGLVPCADLPDSAEPQASLRCGVERGEAHVALEGADVGPATLRSAAAGVRVPSEKELDHLFEEVPVPETPIERGDLPEQGDGAPLDQPGAGG